MHGLTLKYEWHDDDVLSLIVQVANGVFSGAAQVYTEDHTWAPPVLLKDGVLIKGHQHLTMWSLSAVFHKNL